MIKFTNKISLVVILSLVLTSCSDSDTQNKKKSNSVNQEEQKLTLNKIELKDSVFLNLSPKMTDFEFRRAINQQTNLNFKNKTFQILIKNQTLDFQIIKNQNAITLIYFSKDTYKKENNKSPTYNYYEYLTSRFQKKYNQYDLCDYNCRNFESFSKEYTSNKNTDILSLLNNCHLNKSNYEIFRDSLKTISISFSFKFDRVGSMVNQLNGNNTDLFYHIIKIDYYLTKEFDIIKNKILLDYNQYVSNLNEDEFQRKKIIESKKNKLKKNLNQL